MSTVAEQTIVSSRHVGPPGCGNGGWVCGLLAERLDDLVADEGGAATTVRLSAPTPVERPLRWEVDGSVGDPEALAVHLLDGETLLGTARRTGEPELAVPAPVTLEQARDAAATFDTTGHPYPTCFVCGPEAEHGLHVTAAPVESRPDVLAATVVLEDEGLSPVFAALDCPGAFAVGFGEDTLLLGTFTGTLHADVPRGRELVVLAWETGSEGRKRYSGTALFDGEVLLASAAATWIVVTRETIPGTAPAVPA